MNDKKKLLKDKQEKNLAAKQNWNWWPLLPLYPYGRKRTLFKELISNQVWSFDQLQGIYYVAVPIRLIVIRVSGGLMLINPLPPTKELVNEFKKYSVKDLSKMMKVSDKIAQINYDRFQNFTYEFTETTSGCLTSSNNWPTRQIWWVQNIDDVIGRIHHCHNY